MCRFLQIRVGEQDVLIVHLDRPALTDTSVTVTVDDPTIVSVPDQIVIPTGDSSGGSAFFAVAAGTTTIRATLEGVERSITVTINPA